TTMLVTVTPELVTFTPAPATKFVPVKVTFTVAPWVPVLGLIPVRVGAGGVGRLTVNGTGAEVPAVVFTVTLAAPVAALAVIVKVAVIWVVLTTTILVTVTPELVRFTPAPATKFVPVKVTFTVAPWVPVLGLIPVRVGAG